MSTFQFLLFLISAVVFYLFFKQLFSNSYPKRGIDYEAKTDDDQIGGMSEMNKTFSQPTPTLTRFEQLLAMADEAILKKDYIEADKALCSASILDKENIDVLLKHGFVLVELKRFEEAKEIYLEVLTLNPNEDMAYGALANISHKLDNNEKAVEYHSRAIELDNSFAPHYYNYANTLYDLNQKDKALSLYKKALELDPSLENAKEMIAELS